MNLRTRPRALAIAAALLAGTAGSALAAEINIYSTRHYQPDEQLYGVFPKQPGNAINRIEDGRDRKSVVEGMSVAVRLDLGGRRNRKKKKQNNNSYLSIY